MRFPANARPAFLAYVKSRLAPFAAPGHARVSLCSVLVGVIAGLGAVAFSICLKYMSVFVLARLLHYQPPPTGDDPANPLSLPWPWWMLLVVPTLGGLISGILVQTFAPEAEGHGTDAMVRAFHRQGGIIRGRVPLIKALASIITIGTGGSAGQEGPIAQIGAGFGSYLGQVLRLTADERRSLVLAGAAGGIGAIFRAPLGGALFAVEVLYSSTALESPSLLPCLVSSIIAYSTFTLFMRSDAIFSVPNLEFRGLSELPYYGLLAIACTLVGWCFVKVFYGSRDYFFKKLPIPDLLKPMLGGLLVGVVALAVPQVMSGGYGWVQWGAMGMPFDYDGAKAFTPQLSFGMLLAAALVKIVATSSTISSGGSGGVFGPSVFIGGMLGGAFGQLVHSIHPSSAPQPVAFALVGMGGFFAGVSKTPLTSLLMICEISGSYKLLVPLMLVCTITFALSRNWTIFEEQVPTPLESPARQGDFLIDVLERMSVTEAGVRSDGVITFHEAAPLAQILDRIRHSSETLFPVLDASGELSGIFNLHDIRLALLDSAPRDLVIADDLATKPVLSVTADDHLGLALRRMTELNADEIPVVDRDNPKKLAGLLSRRDLVTAYARKMTNGTASESSAAQR